MVQRTSPAVIDVTSFSGVGPPCRGRKGEGQRVHVPVLATPPALSGVGYTVMDLNLEVYMIQFVPR